MEDVTPQATDDSCQPISLYEEVEGEVIPKVFESNRPLKEHVALLKELEMRSDDVIVMAYPKSGTHWVWEITSMLLKGRPDFDRRSKALVMMDATPIEDLFSLPSPRVFNTHPPLRLLPREIKDKGVKVIHVYRNMKDALVSAYFHFKQTPLRESLTFDSLVRFMSTGDVPGMKYVKFLEQNDEFHINHPEIPYFLTSYEDIKEDPGKVVRLLADFLEVKASEELIDSIVRATTLTNMRKANETKDQCPLSMVKIYRKGEVGDWKNYLTVAQSEQLEAEVNKLESKAYHFRYTL